VKRGRVALHDDLDDIEAEEDLGIALKIEPRQRATRDELLFLPRHRFARRAKRQAAPRLDLDEDERVTSLVPADHVHFPAVRRPKVSIQYLIAAALQVARREPFPFPAEPFARILSLFRRTEIPPAGRGEKIGDESDKAHVLSV
jgi:hypothetical protein